MKLVKNILVIPTFLLLTACDSTAPPIDLGPLSKGGQLVVDTKLLDKKEFKQILDARSARMDEQAPLISTEEHTENPFASSDFMFGSGLVSSAVVFTQTGAFINPSNFLNKADLGLWLLEGFLSNAMKNHPSMYHHFYVKNCDSTECFEEKFAAFGNTYVDLILETDAAKNSPFGMKERDIDLSNFMLDQVKINIKDDADKIKNHTIYASISTVYMGEINEDLQLWGNEQVRESPDRMYISKSVGDVKNANILKTASSQHPDVIVYIGIDKKRIDDGKPCFGGFFIAQGEFLPVDEFNCVKFEPEAR